MLPVENRGRVAGRLARAAALGAGLGAILVAAREASRPLRRALETAPCERSSVGDTVTDRTPPGAGSQGLTPSVASYCVDLLPTRDARDARGTVELRLSETPFGIAVTRDGRQRYDLAFSIVGLPDPASLGPFTTFVAWAAAPTFSQVVKLGVIANGRAVLGPIALDRFLILVSAERSADVAEREGRLVLRGMSPSSLMLPTDAAMLPGTPAAAGAPGHHHASTSGWTAPPMHPLVTMMPPGVDALIPNATAWLPGRERDASSIPFARPRTVAALADGDSLSLVAEVVRRRVAGRTIVAYGFNGQHPGPVIRVAQGATVVVNFTNRLDAPTSVHWHGIRLDNRFDGVPHVTQEPVPPGGSFRYVIRFPDAGIYWYHPHVREDIQQDLGLFGNLLVRPSTPGYYGPANRDQILMLDDMLFAGDSLVPYGRERATHALMGRFGNVLLVNGETQYTLAVRRGEVVRFFLTNVSNTRVFNVSLPGARVKVVASDVGLFEREEWVESVVIAPAERYVVDARFDSTGTVPLVNAVQAIDHVAAVFFPEVDTLGLVRVDAARASPDHGAAFGRLRHNGAVVREIAPVVAAAATAPPKALVLSLRHQGLPVALWQTLRIDTGYVNPVEWSGTMPMMDWLPTAAEVRWILRDPESGAENLNIAWRFRVGDRVRLRLVNDRHTLHPMHHPVHIHGQRFLVLARNGVPTRNRVWKDTVLLPTGATLDLLVEMSNPGRWMLHCHIAEHIEAGMHMVFTVDP